MSVLLLIFVIFWDLFCALFLCSDVIQMSQQIRKRLLKYPKCSGGELHNGQIMNMVCIDEKCLHRGILCPICKMQSHDDHYILSIKTFLDQISETFVNRSDKNELNSIADYLQSLEKTKKELVAIMKNQILELCQIFKDLECKIEENYNSIRRNVLIQTSINTKLPNLVEIMEVQNNHDDFKIQEEFKKYCQLIKFRDGKLKSSDKSKKIVEVFHQLPSKIQAQLKNSLENYKKTANQMANHMNIQNLNQELIKQEEKARFSATDKSSNIELSEDRTEAWANGSSHNFIFIDKQFTSTYTETIFKVIKNTSKKILVGIGNVDKIKCHSFQNNNEIDSMEAFVISDGTTSLSVKEGNLSSDSEQQQIPGNKCFEFNDVQTRVLVKYLQNDHKLQFKKLSDGKTFQIKLSKDIKNNSQYKLCFVIGQEVKLQLQASEQ